jgi:hypothetical protein
MLPLIFADIRFAICHYCRHAMLIFAAATLLPFQMIAAAAAMPLPPCRFRHADLILMPLFLRHYAFAISPDISILLRLLMPLSPLFSLLLIIRHERLITPDIELFS